MTLQSKNVLFVRKDKFLIWTCTNVLMMDLILHLLVHHHHHQDPQLLDHRTLVHQAHHFGMETVVFLVSCLDIGTTIEDNVRNAQLDRIMMWVPEDVWFVLQAKLSTFPPIDVNESTMSLATWYYLCCVLFKYFNF